MPVSRVRPSLLLSGYLVCIAWVTPVLAHAQRAPAVEHRTQQTRGTLFIVGGGPPPAELVEKFVNLAGGSRAKIVVFAMASSDGRTSGEKKAQDFRKLGAHAVNVFANHEQANTDSIARTLDGATGVWFGGGDQVLLIKALRGTRTDSAIRARYRAGAVIGGTSAGAAVMSATMITGDELHAGGARPPVDSTDHFLTIARNDIVTEEGFGLIRGAIVDQHFIRRKRHNRLLSLVLERPEHLGVGIDESTALVVHPNGRWSVLGASAAIVYDARHAAITSPNANALGAANVTLQVLPAGSTYDPRTGKATLPPKKR